MGEASPDVEEALPEMGERFPDVGERFPNVGEVFPDLGASSPDVGETSPEMGEMFPDFGEAFPEVGKSSRIVMLCPAVISSAGWKVRCQYNDRASVVVVLETASHRCLPRCCSRAAGRCQLLVGRLDDHAVQGNFCTIASFYAIVSFSECCYNFVNIAIRCRCVTCRISILCRGIDACFYCIS